MISTQDDRIRWRQEVLKDPVGIAWLTEQVRQGAQEKDLGPHRSDCPVKVEAGK